MWPLILRLTPVKRAAAVHSNAKLIPNVCPMRFEKAVHDHALHPLDTFILSRQRLLDVRIRIFATQPGISANVAMASLVRMCFNIDEHRPYCIQYLCSTVGDHKYDSQ